MLDQDVVLSGYTVPANVSTTLSTPYKADGRFFIFRGVGVGVGVVFFILCRCCCCHAWQIIRKLIRFVKNPSQIGALVNFQFALLGLLLGKILAV